MIVGQLIIVADVTFYCGIICKPELYGGFGVFWQTVMGEQGCSIYPWLGTQTCWISVFRIKVEDIWFPCVTDWGLLVRMSRNQLHMEILASGHSADWSFCGYYHVKCRAYLVVKEGVNATVWKSVKHTAIESFDTNMMLAVFSYVRTWGPWPWQDVSKCLCELSSTCPEHNLGYAIRASSLMCIHSVPCSSVLKCERRVNAVSVAFRKR